MEPRPRCIGAESLITHWTIKEVPRGRSSYNFSFFGFIVLNQTLKGICELPIPPKQQHLLESAECHDVRYC